MAILEVFTTVAGIDLDLSELGEQAKAVEEQLGDLLARVEEQYGRQSSAEQDDDDEEEGEGYLTEAEPEEEAVVIDRSRIEELFTQTAKDRSKAFESSSELDRLGLFKEYEDRFLDLFQKPD